MIVLTLFMFIMHLSLYLSSHKLLVVSFIFEPHSEMSVSFWLLSIYLCRVIEDTDRETDTLLHFCIIDETYLCNVFIS